MGISIDGKELAAGVQQRLVGEVTAIQQKRGFAPRLAVVLVGENPASKVYVASKSRAARKIGIEPIDITLPATISQNDLEQELRRLSASSDIDGILLQLPLPGGLDERSAIECIDPSIDVDGLTISSQGKLIQGAEGYRPCTPLGCCALIDRANEQLGRSRDLAGLRAVVVGRSLLVGRPLGIMLLERNCTVTMAHSRTKDLAATCRSADIVVAAVGRPGCIQGEWLDPNAIVIDVGINRLPDGKIVGDVRSPERAAAFTPVPGGVGPMTIAMLLSNTVQSAKNKTVRSFS